MDPFTLMMGASVVMSAYGAYTSTQGAQAASQAQQQEVQGEMAVESQKHDLMELQANRSMMEVRRRGQQAAAAGLFASVSQGAGIQGSGLAGGEAQVSAQSATNMVGINQNLEIGENIYKDTIAIDQAKIAAAQAGSTIATGQGISSLGSSLFQASGAMGRLSQGFGSSNSYSPSTSGANSYAWWA